MFTPIDILFSILFNTFYLLYRQHGAFSEGANPKPRGPKPRGSFGGFLEGGLLESLQSGDNCEWD